MSENKICQSCGVLMIQAADFGTGVDGSISQDLCQECFRAGQFVNPTLTRDLVQQKIAQRLIVEEKLSEEKALDKARILSNQLKRWGLPQPKSIIYYYSKTGNSRLVAEIIAKVLHGDLEEIKEAGFIDVKGGANHLRHGRRSLFGKLIITQPLIHNPDKYELIGIICPVWGFSVPYPVRSFLINFPKNKAKLLLAITHQGSGFKRTLRQLKKLLPSYDLLGEFAITAPLANPADSEKLIYDFLAKSLR